MLKVNTINSGELWDLLRKLIKLPDHASYCQITFRVNEPVEILIKKFITENDTNGTFIINEVLDRPLEVEQQYKLVKLWDDEEKEEATEAD